MNKVDFKITKGQIKNGNNRTREIIQGHKVFSRHYHLCISAKQEYIACYSDLVGYKEGWENMLARKAGKRNGKKTWRSNRGRRETYEHGIHAHNQVSQIVNNWAAISEPLS